MSGFVGIDNSTFSITRGVGADAYIYLFVYVNMYQQLTYDVTNRAPMNKVWYSNSTGTYTNQIFATANADTIYTSFWGNLKIVEYLKLTTPNMKNTDLWWTIQLMSMDTENINIPGDDKDKKSKTYYIVGPESTMTKDDIPTNAKLIRMSTNIIWGIARMEVANYNTELSVNLSLNITLTEGLSTNQTDLNITSITNSIYTSLDFYTLGLYLLNYNTYPQSHEAVIDQFRNIGLDPDVPFNISSLSAPVSAGLLDAAHIAYINEIPLAYAFTKNSFVTNLWTGGRAAGVYGNDFVRRALTQYNGYATNVPQEQFYMIARQSSTGALIDCSLHNYTVTFTASQIPQVNDIGFFSITPYNSTLRMFNDPTARYSVGSNKGDLIYNTDGSLTLYFQTVIPSVVNNFAYCQGITNLIVRIYSATDAEIASPYMGLVTAV